MVLCDFDLKNESFERNGRVMKGDLKDDLALGIPPRLKKPDADKISQILTKQTRQPTSFLARRFRGRGGGH